MLRVARLTLLVLMLTLATHHTSANEQQCFQVESLTLETKISLMRDWLVSYDAKVHVSAKILFRLYIPPQLTEQDAEQIAVRIMTLDEFSYAKVIRKGLLHKGVDLGEFTKPALAPLVATLLKIGYAPAMQPIYNANQQPVMHVLAGNTPLNITAFENTFRGYGLVPTANCYLF